MGELGQPPGRCFLHCISSAGCCLLWISLCQIVPALVLLTFHISQSCFKRILNSPLLHVWIHHRPPIFTPFLTPLSSASLDGVSVIDRNSYGSLMGRTNLREAKNRGVEMESGDRWSSGEVWRYVMFSFTQQVALRTSSSASVESTCCKFSIMNIPKLPLQLE